MKKDFIDAQDFQMRMRAATLWRAFFINLGLGVLAWILTMFPVLLYISVWATGISPMVMYFSIVAAIALWQMLGVLIFFVPAVAISWQRRALRNE